MDINIDIKYGKLNHTHSQHQHQALALRSASHSSQAALWTLVVPLTLIKAVLCSLCSHFKIGYSTLNGFHVHQLIQVFIPVKAKLLDCEWLDCLGHGKANSSSARCSGCSGSSTGTLCSLQICACMLKVSRMHGRMEIQSMHMNAMQRPKDS